MELKSNEFEKMLDEKLIGKDVGYSHWNFSSAVITLIRQLATNAGLKESDFTYEQAHTYNNTIYLRYKGASFGEASFKKMQGNYKYGHYEWVFRKCYISFWNDSQYSSYKGLTFQEMLDQITSEKEAVINREAKKLEQAKEIFKLIQEKLGTDACGTRAFIDYMNQKRYSLAD